MSTSINLRPVPEDRHDQAFKIVEEQPAPSRINRRRSVRERTMLRPCCVESGKTVQFGLIRNISDFGALIQTRLNLQVDDRLTYSWDGLPAIEARVAWHDDRLIGVHNIARRMDGKATHPYRSVRIPCDQPGRIWLNGKPLDCRIVNISMTGALVFGLDPIKIGTPFSLEICGQTFSNAVVRWHDSGSTGIRFATPVHPDPLMQLLDRRNAQ